MPDPPQPETPSLFPPTRWSVVLEAQGGQPTVAHRALGDLCQAYWYPLYAFARSRALAPQDAEDATQAFFQHLLGNGSFNAVAEERGRLRAFLLASMKNFLSTRRREAHALKRGGRVPVLSIDRDWAEGSLGTELAGSASAPEALFDQNWAYALLNAVSRRLEGHYDRAGKRGVYEAIKPCLEGDGAYESSDDLAARLGLSPEGVRSAVFKLRARFREYVEAEVADTCASAEDRRDEIAHLCRILAQ